MDWEPRERLIGKEEMQKMQLENFLHFIDRIRDKISTITCAWSRSEKTIYCVFTAKEEFYKKIRRALRTFQTYQFGPKFEYKTFSNSVELSFAIDLSFDTIEKCDEKKLIELID